MIAPAAASTPGEPEKDVGGSPGAKVTAAVRDAARWLVGGLAAIATVLLAGSQLSSIGKLEEPWRLLIAVGAAVTGFVTIVVAIWWTMDLIMPGRVTLASLTRDEGKQPPTDVIKVFLENPELLYREAASVTDLRAKLNAAVDRQTAAYQAYEADPTDATSTAATRANDEVVALDAVVQSVLDVASVEQLRSLERGWRKVLLVCSVVIATSIVVFAWAANPPTEKATPPVSMRGAVLVGVSLRGAALDGVDLSSADLTRADLTGASVAGAKFENAIWSATICPDGSNSDDVGSTCVGHLE